MEQELRIESDTAVQLASELAALTGESVRDAVLRAIRERLEREQLEPARGRRLTEEEGQEMIARARAITAEIRAHLTGPLTSDHDWLYGEDGLPK